VFGGYRIDKIKFCNALKYLNTSSKSVFFFVSIVTFLNFESTLMSWVYCMALYVINPNWDQSRETPTFKVFISMRSFERMLIWPITSFITALTIVVLYYKMAENLNDARRDKMRRNEEVTIDTNGLKSLLYNPTQKNSDSHSSIN
jgi:hypothetical protein